MKFRPIRDKVVIKQRDAEKITPSGLHIAGGDRPLKGDVIAVGPGRYIDDNTFVETKVKVGDVVIFGKDAGDEVEFDFDESVLVLREAQILAVVDE